MHALLWIFITTLFGSLLSTLIAGLLCFRTHNDQLSHYISFAVGALLSAALLEILPHAFSQNVPPQEISLFILLGIFMFFVMEKLMLWRHCHESDCHGHIEKQPVGVISLTGDGFHGFLDGILIASAFLQDVRLGLLTSLAIFAHEIPQEISDYVVLRHAGYSPMKTLFLNMLVGLSTVAGGIVGYLFLSHLLPIIPLLLALTAGNLIYVALSDLVPTLHRRPEIRASINQFIFIACGVLTLWLIGALLEHGQHG